MKKVVQTGAAKRIPINPEKPAPKLIANALPQDHAEIPEPMRMSIARIIREKQQVEAEHARLTAELIQVTAVAVGRQAPKDTQIEFSPDLTVVMYRPTEIQ